MAVTKLGPDHDVVLPDDVLRESHLTAGDLVEVEMRDGMILLIPLVPKAAPEEDERLASVRAKIAAIRHDRGTAPGLSAEEAVLAVRAGLIPEAERFWWQERWLDGEREAEEDIAAGRVKTFADADAFFAGLGD